MHIKYGVTHKVCTLALVAPKRCAYEQTSHSVRRDHYLQGGRCQHEGMSSTCLCCQHACTWAHLRVHLCVLACCDQQ